MGIQEFTEIRDYCILCVVLMFLEDREEEEQFLLSELIVYVETQLKAFMQIDWTSFTQRKSLVRVLQYLEKLHVLRVYEGSSEAFGQEAGREVLYENTGYSKYFATSFPRDISGYESWQDFEKADFEELSTERGQGRVHRVYRQLVACPAFYWEENDDADALYLKNQRQWVSRYLGENLDIHKNAAFWMLEEDAFGAVHPRDAMLPEAVLLFCGYIQELLEEGRLERQENERVIPTKVYEILNDSLQTLTDEDLRPMADAMEKMDEIQESLDRLKRAFGDVRIIRTEYTRYNQFMLAKKAQAYLSRKVDVEKAQARLEEQLAAAQEIRERQRENEESLNARKERERLARAERDSLLDDKLKDMDVRLETARREQQEAEERERQWEKKAEDYNGKIFVAERKEKELQDELSCRQAELQEERAQLQERQEVLQWEGHPDAVSMLEEGRLPDMPEITKRLGEYEKNLAEGKKRIHDFEEASAQYEEAALALEQLKKEKAEQEKRRQLAEKRLQEGQDDWISLLYEKADRAVEWKPERGVLREAEELAREYESVSDAGGATCGPERAGAGAGAGRAG